MKQPRAPKRRRRFVPPLLVFLAGGVSGWWLHSWNPEPPATVVVRGHTGLGHAEPVIAADPPEPVIRAAKPDSGDLIADLRARELRLPLEHGDVGSWKGQFDQPRGGGTRTHEAVDLLAPRHTPVYAVDDGTIARLFVSKAGGNTIYQFDEDERACFYYAHLERYAEGLREGQKVEAGDVIGYVGTSGNAPPDTPHLHFAVFELSADKRWWEGRAIDPFLIYGPSS
jgi:murein DD-endopeptidase MepM/ murein hydrolase activator NlpD